MNKQQLIAALLLVGTVLYAVIVLFTLNIIFGFGYEIYEFADIPDDSPYAIHTQLDLIMWVMVLLPILFSIAAALYFFRAGIDRDRGDYYYYEEVY
jgi:formate hydrogenlyase subunit 3/multisubunit Na+/H+ antiporter MnhD subunit